MLQNAKTIKGKFCYFFDKIKEIVLDYLKSVLVYPEVSCCHVTAIIPCATKRASSSPWFQTLLLWSRRSFCLLVLGSYRVELGSNEGRKMYWKQLKRFAVMTMLRQNEVAVSSFSCPSDLILFLYHMMQIGVTALSLTNVTDMWCNTVTDVHLM